MFETQNLARERRTRQRRSLCGRDGHLARPSTAASLWGKDEKVRLRFWTSAQQLIGRPTLFREVRSGEGELDLDLRAKEVPLVVLGDSLGSMSRIFILLHKWSVWFSMQLFRDGGSQL